jgi:hypothetical protein
MATTTTSSVTLNEVRELSTLFNIVKDGARVRWLNENSATTALLDGVARHFVRDPQTAAFLNWETDNVFEAYLRISGTFEYFLPVREVLDLIGAGEFGRD